MSSLLETVIFGGLDRANLDSTNVRCAFRLRLPFRLRVGELYRFRPSLVNDVEICIRNVEAIPYERTREQTINAYLSGARLTSDALILKEAICLTSIQLDQIRDGEDVSICAERQAHFTEMLNDFIVAYHSVAHSVVTGNQLHELSLPDFLSSLNVIFTIICPTDYEISDSDVLQLFDYRSDAIGSTARFSGRIADIDAVLLKGIDSAFLRHHNHMFYEFAFLAQSYMEAQNIDVALLMALIALEGAHAAFFRTMFVERVQADEQEARKLADSILSGGIYGSSFSDQYKRAIRMFMEESQRPSSETINACDRAVTIRNDIMHARTDKAGQYKLRSYSLKEKRDALDAALVVYRCFVGALEMVT